MAKLEKPIPPSIVVTARIPQAVKDGLDKAAREDARTTSSLMAKILADWLAAKKKTRAPK